MNRLLTCTLTLLLSALFFAGCGKTPADKTEDAAGLPDMPPDTVEMDEHPTEGPHHGDLIELGQEDYHGEIVHEEKDNTVTIYLLDGPTAKEAVPIDEKDVTINISLKGKPTQFKLEAKPDSGDPEGKSSRFVSSDPELIKQLDTEGAEARLTVKINGKSFIGKIVHDHDHPGHKH